MAETRIEFNPEGFRQILLSEGCKELIQTTTEDICQKANANNTRGGEGFESNVIVGGYGGGRWIGFVSTTDENSKIAEAEDLALSRAIT